MVHSKDLPNASLMVDKSENNQRCEDDVDESRE